MARRKKRTTSKRRKNRRPTRSRSAAARKSSRRPVRKSSRRKISRRRNFLKKPSRMRARRSVGRRPLRRLNPRLRRSALSRLRRRRNAGREYGEMAKDLGLQGLRAAGGLGVSLLVGRMLGGFAPQYSGYLNLAGNGLTAIGLEVLRRRGGAQVNELVGVAGPIGAAGAFVINALDMAARAYAPSISAYLPSLNAPAPVIVVDNGVVDNGVVDNGVVDPAVNNEGTGAFVEQAGLYGSMGSLDTAMRHQLKMAEGGMSGGIFDAKTTLGEYDILDSAPTGTSVQAGLAEYVKSPPFGTGANVRAATAGMGAQVEEAFAGLNEYVQVPLSDYVETGGPQAYWSRTSQGQQILGQIQQAARRITAERMRAGLPVDYVFRQNLQKAAIKAVQGGEKDVSMAAPAPPLTRAAAPFPGASVADVGWIAGQPAAIHASSEEYMDDGGDGGIFG